MKQKACDKPIDNEANNGLKNLHYTVAMARTGDPHSATAQFFINVADNGFLNHTAISAQGWGYAVFGKVVGGAEVVDIIAAVKTSRTGYHDDVPVEDIRRFDAEFLDYLARDKGAIFDAIRQTNDLSDDSIKTLESAIAEFKKQFTTNSGALLVNDAPVAAIKDEEIDPTKITKVVRN